VELLAFASFGVLVLAWVVAPIAPRTAQPAAVEPSAERDAGERAAA
jgi:hypothetical protein